MSAQGAGVAAEAGEGGLGHDGLKQGGGELSEEPPGIGLGQAVARRGESSNAPMSGSSSRIIKR
jgi:hypothetical protein